MRKLVCWLYTTTAPNHCGWYPKRSTTTIGRNFVSTRGYYGWIRQRRYRSTSSCEEGVPLCDRLKEAFHNGQTDAVRDVAVSWLDSDSNLTADALIKASIDAAQGKKGPTVSMLNAILGACAQDPADERKRSLTVAMMDSIERTYQDDFRPDMLTYALAYSALEGHDANQAHGYLEKAQRQSKKIAGSSRRKALAASRRKSTRTATERQSDLQALLGQDFAVLSETDAFVVLNKPSGTVVNHSHTTTSGKIGKRNADVSLVDALMHVNVPLSTLNPEALGIVHRLDRGTSGCIVLAKTDRMHATLVTEFFLRRAHKLYHTIVAPAPATARQGTLDLPVDGRPARSNFGVLKTRGQDLALIEMETLTGRKHQVRVHAALGLHAPVLLDSLYGQSAAIPDDVEHLLKDVDTNRERFFLHAASLNVPRVGLSVSADKPTFWNPIVELFESNSLA